jgi:uncharacterized Ntn-hydrolase superfamily protein
MRRPAAVQETSRGLLGAPGVLLHDLQGATLASPTCSVNVTHRRPSHGIPDGVAPPWWWIIAGGPAVGATPRCSRCRRRATAGPGWARPGPAGASSIGSGCPWLLRCAPAMTFSIVAHDPATGDLGVAVASRALACGSVVPWARSGVGAVATQAGANVTYGPQGLALLATGRAPEAIVATLTGADPLAAHRQVAIMDARGRAAGFTGGACLAWAGGRTGPHWACQGNILTGPEVLDAMAAAFEATAGDLAARLLTALRAGQDAGGDRRGRQSAGLLVVRAPADFWHDDRLVDLRVDDHPDPIVELDRLIAVWRTAGSL